MMEHQELSFRPKISHLNQIAVQHSNANSWAFDGIATAENNCELENVHDGARDFRDTSSVSGSYSYSSSFSSDTRSSLASETTPTISININQTIFMIRLLFFSPVIYILVQFFIHDPFVIDNTAKDIIEIFEGETTFSDNFGNQGTTGTYIRPNLPLYPHLGSENATEPVGYTSDGTGRISSICPSDRSIVCCNGIFSSSFCNLPINQVMFPAMRHASSAPQTLYLQPNRSKSFEVSNISILYQFHIHG
mmetsp:Transcript_22489/g.51499  ORF Transcript_22489/g.51499 Transcript_22489/m.51499 type:complete len:249 (+) Transcript_22489:18-764(+)